MLKILAALLSFVLKLALLLVAAGMLVSTLDYISCGVVPGDTCSTDTECECLHPEPRRPEPKRLVL